MLYKDQVLWRIFVRDNILLSIIYSLRLMHRQHSFSMLCLERRRTMFLNKCEGQDQSTISFSFVLQYFSNRYWKRDYFCWRTIKVYPVDKTWKSFISLLKIFFFDCWSLQKQATINRKLSANVCIIYAFFWIWSTISTGEKNMYSIKVNL